MPIRTVTDLHEHLQLALRVELATIPPYLYAMYSIDYCQTQVQQKTIEACAAGGWYR